ncbi:hypothetical protein LUZ61_001241 [Rhynchospora tenuis]|uniref:UBP-type domain-containing protein n=1 Tax=Rhynchospora tenuis TaxID=198213 RepID=A0AAD5ZGV0_9POAL|nr:hypothetical protein LUZ61_001241 [Rhynchospora tenuis]
MSTENSRIRSEEFDLAEIYGAESGWVEARSTCDHLPSLCADLLHIPPPDTPCSRCEHPAENWLCLSCKEVLCSRFVNKHMLSHHQETAHSLALSFSDLSVWCFSCEAYLDVQLIRELHPVYEVAHLLKFGERPPFRNLEILQLSSSDVEGSSKS